MGSYGPQQAPLSAPPSLDERFGTLKRSLVKPEHKQKVVESYRQLIQTLSTETARIKKLGPRMVPDIDFEAVRANGGFLPADLADLVRERGCVVLRNVVDEEQATKWETSLRDYVTRHPGVGGHPGHRPAAWNVFWTRAQVEMRSHPSVLQAMRAVSNLWHVSDPATPIDLDSQVVYPDRVRIRYPSTDPGQFPLEPHLDSGAVERWEDEAYRRNYASIFEGNWQEWDGWRADDRVEAQSDLYQTSRIGCTTWRSLQGWLSLSHTNTGEGTLRVLPSLKASVAYIMLRPLFLAGGLSEFDDEGILFDDTTASFPGSSPGNTQFFPTGEWHRHLGLNYWDDDGGHDHDHDHDHDDDSEGEGEGEGTLVGIPDVRPGDYVFWHCDLVHGVDRLHRGQRDSTVFYNPCSPLTPANARVLVSARDAFVAGRGQPPVDFRRAYEENPGWEKESGHGDDCGARERNILSEEGLEAMGIRRRKEEEDGLTVGQKEVRRLANAVLGL